MTKRAISFLLAVALVLSLCACGSGAEDGKKDDAAVKTVQDYTEALYVGMISMMTSYYDSGIKIFRFDYDKDGRDDWLVRYDSAQPFWMLYKSGMIEATPTVFFNWGAAGSLDMQYSESDDSVYVKNAYSVLTHGYESYFRYDGTAHDFCLSNAYSDDNAADNAEAEYTYQIGEKQVSKKEYDDELGKLKLKQFRIGEYSFNAFLGIPADLMKEVVGEAGLFSFVADSFTADVNGDGEDEFVFATKIENKDTENERPYGVPGVSYECGNKPYDSYGFGHYWRTPYFVLSADGKRLYIADESAVKAAKTAAVEPKSTEKITSGSGTSSPSGKTGNSTSANGKNSELFNIITGVPGGEWYARDNYPFVADTFKKDGSLWGGVMGGQGTWKVCDSDKIEVNISGKRTVYTVSFEYVAGKTYDYMVLTSSDNVYRYVSAQTGYARLKKLDGVWQCENGGSKLYINGDSGISYKWEGDSEYGMIFATDTELVLLREFPNGSLGDFTYFDIVGNRLRLSSKNSRAQDAPVKQVYYDKVG